MIDKIKIFILTSVIIIACFVLANQAWAEKDYANLIFELPLHKLSKTVTFRGFDKDISLSVSAKTFTQSQTIEITKIDLPVDPPEGFKLTSAVYEYNVQNKKVLGLRKPFGLGINYTFDYTVSGGDYSVINLSDNYYAGFADYTQAGENDYTTDYTIVSEEYYDRSIWLFDKTLQSWQRIKSFSNFELQKITALVDSPRAILAVFQKKEPMLDGRASWYKYKDCDCAASPDYPKGTKLLVTNTDNGKSVIVTINDWGPERDKFPNRVIDLDVTAFKKIANKRLGTCPVKIEKIDN